MALMAIRFFEQEGLRTGDTVDPMRAVPANAPRPITASAERLKIARDSKDRVEKRPTSEWQIAAWQHYDSIGEVHFAFSFIGQVMSRVRLFAGIVAHADEPPIHGEHFIDSLVEKSGKVPEQTKMIIEEADDIIRDLGERAQGGVGQLLRSIGMNLSIPGECYLLSHKEKWFIASTDELTQQGDTYRFNRRRKGGSTLLQGGDGGDETLDANAFVARIWRNHPRYSYEPDSSMLGALDDCEQLVLMQQAMRSMTRSRMNAGMMFIPDGIAGYTADGETQSIEAVLARASVESVEDESSKFTVTPLIARGAADLGDKIKWIPWGRQIDKDFIMLMDRTLQRVLQGLDIPKDIVTGLADVKYSNAIIIDENLYRGHVEPLVLLAVDALTEIYLKPMLKRRLFNRLGGLVDEEGHLDILDRIVVWADTSDIVTRPDKSQAANEGYDKHILSARAWRTARGFSEEDAPAADEQLTRLALERANIPEDIAQELLRRLDPEFFEQARAANSDLPQELDMLLTGEEPAEEPTEDVTVPDDLSSLDEATQGGDVTPGGSQPPSPRPSG